MGKKKRKGGKKPIIHRDELGEFRWETFFVRGKQRRRKIRLIDGIPVDEFIENNADEIYYTQERDYEALHRLEMERDGQQIERGNGE